MKQEEKVRVNDTQKRGMSIESRLQCAAVAQCQQQQEFREYETKVMIFQQQKNNMMKEIGQANKIARAFCPGPDKDDKFWKEVFELKQRSKDLDKDLEELQCKKRKAHDVVMELLDSNNISVPQTKPSSNISVLTSTSTTADNART